MVDHEFSTLFGLHTPLYQEDSDHLISLNCNLSDSKLKIVEESLKREIVQSLTTVDHFVLESMFWEAAGLPFSWLVNGREFTDVNIQDRFYIKPKVQKLESLIEPRTIFINNEKKTMLN